MKQVTKGHQRESEETLKRKGRDIKENMKRHQRVKEETSKKT